MRIELCHLPRTVREHRRRTDLTAIRMRRFAQTAVGATALALFALGAAGCNGLTGGSTVSQPPIPPQTSFNVVGDPGTPFIATIWDSNVSYEISGSIPLSVGFINNVPPIQMTAVKKTGSNALLSVEILNIFGAAQVASTSAPFGSATVQFGGTFNAKPPPAFPDVRFFVKGPYGGLFTALIEDQNTGFATQGSAPNLFLFEAPTGTVVGQFTANVFIGNLDIDLIHDGQVIARGVGGPTLTVK
jgi:hypothetical protein